MGKWDRCASCKRDGVLVIWAVSPGPTACDWVTLWLTLVISRQMEMQMPESHLCAACMHCINSQVTYLCEMYFPQNYQKAKLQHIFAGSWCLCCAVKMCTHSNWPEVNPISSMCHYPLRSKSSAQEDMCASACMCMSTHVQVCTYAHSWWLVQQRQGVLWVGGLHAPPDLRWTLGELRPPPLLLLLERSTLVLSADSGIPLTQYYYQPSCLCDCVCFYMLCANDRGGNKAGGWVGWRRWPTPRGGWGGNTSARSTCQSLSAH